jgi:MYXO-CTERM domain-containing protein
MNVKNLTVFAGCVASLSFGAIAAADYSGMSADLVYSGALGGTSGRDGDVYRIYVDFDGPGGSLNAVYGDATQGLLIEAETGSFYQNAFGGNTSKTINPALYGPFPSLVYDSWVTIGSEDMNGNSLNDIGIDFGGFGAGGAITTTDGSWFTTPDDAQSYAGGDNRVLVGQFTVDVGDSVVGYVNLQGKYGDMGGDQTTWSASGQTWVPAPGALALLGVAGLAGRRRRRA